MRLSIAFCIALLLALIGGAGAIPTTGAATAISNNNFSLHATGCVGSTNFQWGISPTWQGLRSVNHTPVAGVVDSTEYGSPIMPSTLYYARACDSTGCGNVVSFTTTALTPIVERTAEDPITNMTRSRFNLVYAPSWVAFSYTVLFPGQEQTAIMLITMFIFIAIFAGMWMSSKSTHTGIAVGILVVSLLGTTGAAGLGLPGELLGISQGIMYASFAGIFLSWLHK